MSYSSIVEMTTSGSLMQRVAACAAEEGLISMDPLSWAQQNIWKIVATGNWDAAWDSARAGASPDVNPDTGAREDVITDGMILAVVQPMVLALNS